MSIKQKTVTVKPRQGQPLSNQTQNLTIHFQIIDKWNSKIPGATVEIYLGTILLVTSQTNATGMVQTILPPGTYKIKVFYGDMQTMETYTFINDEMVVFLLSQNDTPVPESSGFDMIYIIIGIICIIGAVSFIIIGRVKVWI